MCSAVLSILYTRFKSFLVLLSLLFFFSRSGDHRDLHSFPTRRSSDLHLTFYAGWWRLVSGISADVQKGPACLSSNTDRKSTRLNSSHVEISYAVFCLKKKKEEITRLEHEYADQDKAMKAEKSTFEARA